MTCMALDHKAAEIPAFLVPLEHSGPETKLALPLMFLPVRYLAIPSTELKREKCGYVFLAGASFLFRDSISINGKRTGRSFNRQEWNSAKNVAWVFV